MNMRMILVALGVVALFALLFIMFGGHAAWAVMFLISLRILYRSIRCSWPAMLVSLFVSLLLLFLTISDLDPLKLGVYSASRTSWHGITAMFQAMGSGITTFFATLFNTGTGGITVFLTGIIFLFFAWLLLPSSARWAPIIIGVPVLLYWSSSFWPSASTSKSTWQNIVGLEFNYLIPLAILLGWIVFKAKSSFVRVVLGLVVAILIIAVVGPKSDTIFDGLKAFGSSYQRTYPSGVVPSASPAISSGWNSFVKGIGDLMGWVGSQMSGVKPAPAPKPAPSGSGAAHAATAPPKPSYVVRDAIFNYGDMSRPVTLSSGQYSMFSSNGQSGLHIQGGWQKFQNNEVLSVYNTLSTYYACTPPCVMEIKKLD